MKTWKYGRKHALLPKEFFELNHDSAFPKDSGFIRQINDAAGSVMDNRAEGFERGSKKEFVHFLSVSKGSAGEVRSQVHRRFDRHYFPVPIFQELFEIAERISKRLSNFMTSVNQSIYAEVKLKGRQE